MRYLWSVLALVAGLWAVSLVASASEALVDEPLAAVSASSDRHLVVAWSDQPPYQFQAERRGIGYPSGVDVAVLRAAAKHAGLSVSFRYQPFDRSLALLASGRIDVVPGAYESSQRRRYAQISPAYRQGRDRLFLPARTRLPTAATLAALTDALIASENRVAVVRGYDWGATDEPLLERLEAHGLVHRTDSLAESISAVLDQEADAFLGDQLASMALLAQWREQGLRMHPLILQERSIHMLFAKDALPAWHCSRSLRSRSRPKRAWSRSGSGRRSSARSVRPAVPSFAI